MKSMTGFGRSSNRHSEKGRSASESVQLDITLRSVNGRFLETRWHLPREYSGLESEFKAIIARYFSRGTLDLYVNRMTVAAAPEIRVNTGLARKWFDSYRDLGKNLNLRAEPTLELLARIPEVFKVEESLEIGEDERDMVRQLLDDAAKACNQERKREGEALQTELEALCLRLESLAAQMEALKSEANQELQRRYRERLQKLGFEGNVDDQRIAQEIVVQLDRTDISEELTRLKEHIKAYRQLLRSSEPQGKKLDFYAQELLREVNTIGSKSHIAKLTSLVVDAKTLVEKIREQVQNVE